MNALSGSRIRRGACLAGASLRLDHVPDFGGDIRLAEPRDAPDAARRGHVDFREIAVDDVDADEQQSALAQRRAQCLADLALAWGEIGGLRRAPADHVGAQIVRRAHTRLTAPANSQRVSRQELVMQVPRDEILA